MDTKKLDRRTFLRMAGIAGAATVAAACKPEVVYETVEKDRPRKKHGTVL